MCASSKARGRQLLREGQNEGCDVSIGLLLLVWAFGRALEICLLEGKVDSETASLLRNKGVFPAVMFREQTPVKLLLA